MGLTLISAIFGGYDHVHPLPQDHGFDDAVLITDDPDLDAPGWRVLHIPSTTAPRLAAKAPKLTPWRYVDADATVWIDGSCQVLDGKFRAWIDDHDPVDLRAWNHPEPRTCLYQEAEYCQDWAKYTDQAIRQQTADYRAAGMPENYGLWACGTLLWRHTPAAQSFGEAWLAEQTRSIQDQISLPYLLWSRPLQFEPFDGHQYLNPYLRWHVHRGYP